MRMIGAEKVPGPIASNEPSTSDDREAVLVELLNAGLEIPPEYRGGLTNHLPMALHALYELGASSQRMRAFHTMYIQRFQANRFRPNFENQAPSSVDWLQFRGLPDAYPTLLAYFDEHIFRHGMEGTLEKSLPDLLSGVSAAGFHGVIRTAHALQAKHPREMAAALGYWAWRWQPLAQTPTDIQLLPFERWSQCLVEQAKEEKLENPDGLIRDCMDEACTTFTYKALAGALAPASSLEKRIAQLASFSINRYLASRNFTVLHMVTGARALRILLPSIDDSHQTQLLVAQCFTAAYLAAGVEPLSQIKAFNLQDWKVVMNAAMESDNEHVIKMVHACRDEASVYASDLYLIAANLAIE